MKFTYIILQIFVFTFTFSLIAGSPALRSGSDCSICLTPLDETVLELPCSHSFHKGCLISWFKEDRAETGRPFNCPVCRRQISLIGVHDLDIDPEKDLNIFNSTIRALISTYREIKVLRIKTIRTYLAWDELLDLTGKYSDDDISILVDIVGQLELLEQLEKKAANATYNPRFQSFFHDEDSDDEDD